MWWKWLMISGFVVAGTLITGVLALNGREGSAAADESQDVYWVDRTLTVRPAAQPDQAMRYQLLPRAVDRQPGNAAAKYREAFRLLDSAKEVSTSEDELHFEVSHSSMTQLRGESGKDIKQQLEPFEPAIDMAAEAARKDTCNWDYALRAQGALHPQSEPPAVRRLGIYLAVRAQLAMAERRFDDAISDLQTMMAMGRHISKTRTSNGAIVGASLVLLAQAHLVELIQQPDSPNLYWAFSTLPRPMIDLHSLLEMDHGVLFWTTHEKDIHKWRKGEVSHATLSKAMDAMVEVLGDIHGPLREMTTLSAEDRASRLKTHIRKTYPRALDWLADQDWENEAMEGLEPHEAVAAYHAGVFTHARNRALKWVHLPLGERRYDKARTLVEEYKDEDPSNPVVVVIPAIEHLARTIDFSVRMIEVHRVLEAVRLHAAGNDGELPESLGGIEAVPVPDDPVTGTPFNYEREGDTVVIATAPDEKDPLGRGVRLTVRFDR